MQMQDKKNWPPAKVPCACFAVHLTLLQPVPCGKLELLVKLFFNTDAIGGQKLKLYGAVTRAFAPPKESLLSPCIALGSGALTNMSGVGVMKRSHLTKKQSSSLAQLAGALTAS